jgi:hypothetical protein
VLPLLYLVVPFGVGGYSNRLIQWWIKQGIFVCHVKHGLGKCCVFANGVSTSSEVESSLILLNDRNPSFFEVGITGPKWHKI